MKPKRFFYHYNKPEAKKQGRNVMTVHWEGACHMVNHVKIKVPYLESHAQKRQPHCIMRGLATSITFDTKDNETTAYIVHS